MTLGKFSVAALAWITSCAALYGQAHWGRSYGRSMVITQNGIAATSQILASQTAAGILARGGSAADAAIAANAVLGVVEPMMDGPGGDLFALYWDAATKQYVGLNGSGPAPKGLTPRFLANKDVKEMPTTGIQSVTVPGAVAGWAAMHKRFGKLPWKDLFGDAIAYAERGFPVTEAIQEQWSTTTNVEKLKTDPESARVFLPNGRAPHVGELFKNPDLARAYRLIAQDPESFYKGALAEAILTTSHKLGGTMTAEDLSSFSPEWVSPISTDYRGWRVYELPPNGQGMAALEMLDIMSMFQPAAAGPLSANEMHVRIEAMKLAYSDLRRYDADPRTGDVPVKTLLSPEWARERAALINMDSANCNVAPGRIRPGDTTYLAVVDRAGNMASWIQSVSLAFGSAVTVRGMGFVLQDRGAGFTLDPASPDVLAGGKRPFHTIIPAFADHANSRVAFGIMGGANQPLAHAQFVSNMVDYGMNIQAALEAPRFTKAAANGCDVSIESRVPESTLQQLSERGHQIAIRREYTQEMGRGQAILHDSKTNTNFAASGPRADGAALPEPLSH